MLDLRSRRSSGFTIAELITVVAIIAILSAVAMPVARFGLRRQKEIELRERLRKITEAIDRYHDLMTLGQVQPGAGGGPGGGPGGGQVNIVRPAQMEALGAEGYPKDFDELLKGVAMSDGKTIKLIRERDLIDPMTGRAEWSVLSTKDDPESSFSTTCELGSGCSAEHIYEIHSTSTALALDGKTRYNEW
jgi:general secretion pathway protein G